MDNKKAALIGNENFKQWLRTLDSSTRVRYMSAIVNSLAKMSLRGFEIKAALAQLSQRCQVMLPRLTKKEIKRLTRRRPLQKLQNSNPAPLSVQHEERHNKLCSVMEGKRFASGKDIMYPSNYKVKKLNDQHDPKLSPIVCTYSSEKHYFKEPISIDICQKQQKQKERFKELFGDEPNEGAVTPNTSLQTEKASSENKYMSTTVNVNYYNIYNTAPNNSLSIKRKSHTENTLLTSSAASQKKLRIDVSLSNKESLVLENEELAGVVESKESERKKSSHKHSKRKSSSGKKKSKKNSLPRANVNNTDEHPSIKELWSILGMESPIDRTAKFFSDRLNFSSADLATTQSASKEANATETSVNSPHMCNNAHVLAVDTLNDSGNGTPTTPGISNRCENEFALGSDESFLKISGAFSLAEFQDRGCNNSNNDDSTSITTITPTPSTEIVENSTTNNEKGRQDKVSNETVKHTIGNFPESLIETICLDEENSEDIGIIGISENINNLNKETVCRKTSVENKSKVGTIRVKSIGLLIDPQLEATSNKNKQSTDNTTQSDMAQSSDAIEQMIEKRFLATYAYYFDDTVETEIPKLGELLHLAIADNLRWGERIKRAEQLSSEDLIKEEKQRAEKDFNDSIKSRGAAFYPACDLIVKRFDPGSKITLFTALFCRILKHAGNIDPVNKNHVLEAKRVISLMLKKHRYRDKDILKTLESSNEDFKDQVSRTGELVAKCGMVKDNRATSTSALPSSNNNVSSRTLTANEVSQRGGRPDCQTLGNKEESGKLLQQILSSGKTNQPVNGLRKVIDAPKITQIKSQQNILQNDSAMTNKIINTPKNVTSSGTQQSLVRKQTNQITDNRFYRQETPHIDNDKVNSNKVIFNNSQSVLAKQNVISGNDLVNLVNSSNKEMQNCLNSVLASAASQAQKAPLTTATVTKPAQTVISSQPISRISTSDISLTVLSKPDQPATSSPQTNNRIPTSDISLAVLSSMANTSLPLRFVNTYVQQPFLVTSALTQPRLKYVTASNTVPGRGGIIFVQRPRLSHTNSVPPKISVRNVVDHTTPSIVGVGPNHLRMARLHEDNITNKSSREIAVGKSTIHPDAILQTGSSSSPPAPTSAEVTSPNAEVNLPSSSHCHPFIARRPISGKMKMLFENNSN